MPRFDGTGPQGMGPRTGRGQGPCSGGNRRGYGCRGCGFGGFGPMNQWSYRQPTAVEEKDIIMEDINELKEELKAAEERLSQLEGQK